MIVGNKAGLVLSATGVATLSGNDQTITVNSAFVLVDAGGSARTGAILPAANGAGQILVLHNEGGELITFNTTPTTSRVKGSDSAGTDALSVGAVTPFILSSTDNLWVPLSLDGLE